MLRITRPVMIACNFEAAKEHAIWGTFGINGDEPLKYVLLKECSTEHLENILRLKHVHTTSYADIIRSILDDRNGPVAQ